MWMVFASALAGPVFLSVGAETAIDINGNWPKAFPTAEGFHLLNAAAGAYNHQYSDKDLVVDAGSRRVLTGAYTGLQDHAVARCPDGNYLHVASATLVSHDDSMYAFTYDADFQPLDDAVVAERTVDKWWNDMPLVCGETFRGTGYYDKAQNDDLVFVRLDEDLRVIEHVPLYGAPFALGSAMLEEDGLLTIVGAPNKDDDGFIVSTYDEDFNLLARREVRVMPSGWYPYWTQGFVRHGDYYIVAHLAQDTRYAWDTQGGDLWLQAFDTAWNLVDQVQLTANTAPIGGLQPSIAVRDGRLFAFYTKSQVNYAWTVELVEVDEPVDTGDTGEPPDDTGEPPDDTGDPPDTDTDDPGDDTGADTGRDTGHLDDEDGCGCAGASGGGGVAVGLALLAVARRRRR